MSADESSNTDQSEGSGYRDEPDHTNPKNQTTGSDDRDDDAEDRAVDDVDADEARAEVEEIGEQVGLEESTEGAGESGTDSEGGDGSEDNSASSPAAGVGDGSVSSSSPASGSGGTDSTGGDSVDIPSGSSVILEDGTTGVVTMNSPTERLMEVSTPDGFRVVDPDEIADHQLPEGVRGESDSVATDGATAVERGQEIREKTPLPTNPGPESIPDGIDQLKSTWHEKTVERMVSRGIDDPVEHREQLREAVGELVEDADPRVRVRQGVLGDILDDGRFKTQFETQTSGGMFDPEKRSDFEAAWMGYGKDEAAERRPIYGYLGEPPGGDVEGGPEFSLKHYGEVSVRLSDSVREHTTFTVGDSLQHDLLDNEENIEKCPAKLTDPDETAVGYTMMSDPLGRIQDRDLASGGAYVEAQYHGGLTVGDIEEVVFTNGKEPPAELRSKLEDNGISYRTKS